MSISIFVSHSFDHAEKLLGVMRFIRHRGIAHVDHSVPAWDPYVGPDVQAGGITWRNVRTPDGKTGYVPAQYTQEAP